MTIPLKDNIPDKKIYKQLLRICLWLIFIFASAKGEGLLAGASAVNFLNPRPSFSRHSLFLHSNQGQDNWRLQLFHGQSFQTLGNDEEEEEMREFHGLGLEIRVMGGWNYFAGGDFHRGTRGLFDERADIVLTRGYKREFQNISSCRSGLGFGAEAIYHLRPRLGIGVRVSFSHPAHPSELKFYEVQALPYLLWSDIDLKILSFMAGFYYMVPAHRRLWLFFSGGPELHLVNYQYALNFTTPTSHEEISQKADGRGLGARGSAGLELHLNPRVALFFEIHGRLAKISNFQGKEATYHLEGYSPSTSEANGFLYYSEAGKYPGLAIFSEDAAQGKGVKRAVFDFSGMGLHTGLIFRF